MTLSVVNGWIARPLCKSLLSCICLYCTSIRVICPVLTSLPWIFIFVTKSSCRPLPSTAICYKAYFKECISGYFHLARNNSELSLKQKMSNSIFLFCFSLTTPRPTKQNMSSTYSSTFVYFCFRPSLFFQWTHFKGKLPSKKFTLCNRTTRLDAKVP